MTAHPTLAQRAGVLPHQLELEASRYLRDVLTYVVPKGDNAMSDKTNGSASASTSAVATNDGKLVQLPDMVVAATRIHNFVEKFRKEYFEDHGLEWCLDEIISRGCAEITRQV